MADVGYLSLGANLGDRAATLEAAIQALHDTAGVQVKAVSGVYENPALVPDGAPATWHQPYLNLALEIETTRSPLALLDATQGIEQQFGRTGEAPRWAPRVLDIDIISCGGQRFTSDRLELPHPRAHQRDFVLAPLKDLNCELTLPGQKRNILQLARASRVCLPAWMQIINATPDSFSGDGGAWTSLGATSDAGPEAQYLDVGAESTRPGATPVAPDEEWRRLAPLLATRATTWLQPRLSIDTRYATTAQRALQFGVHVINDVAGLQDPAMLNVVAATDCDVVLMHSLSVPAAPAVVLAETEDVVELVCEWLAERIEQLQRAGVARRRIIIDPGLGFGKTAAQSWALVRGVDRLLELPCRLLIGHSRKSFLASVTRASAAERDLETVAVSERLAQRGVDLLRVHNLDLHQRFRRAAQSADGAVPTQG
ncbi:MAG: dihydropteroate synthase [Pseudomonadota bacterium]